MSKTYKSEELDELRALFEKNVVPFIEANKDLRVQEKWHTGKAMWHWMIDQGMVSERLHIAGDENHDDPKAPPEGHPLWRIAFRRKVRKDPRLDYMMVGARKGPQVKFGSGPVEVAQQSSVDEPSVNDDEVEANLDDVGEPSTITEQHAKLALNFLLKHVLQQRDGVMPKITYLELAGEIGRVNKHGLPWARGMGRILFKITQWLDDLKNPWPEEIPYLTTVVVAGTGKNKGLPGIGVAGKWRGYDSLSRIQKEEMVNNEYDRILNFGSRWAAVADMLGLEGIEMPELPPGGSISGKRGGGESPAHEALKLHVLANPQLVGAEADSFGKDEADLLSGDIIDVLFRSKTHWVGVEVKSRTSDKNFDDYRRGVFQAIKYQAVLKAQAKYEFPNDTIAVKVYLVLETNMPAEYMALVEQHEVNVIAQVVPTPVVHENNSVPVVPMKA